MNNIMLPAPHKILKVVKETRAEYTFRVAYEGETRHGQFFQLSIPKVGEAPISVSGKGKAGWNSPSERWAVSQRGSSVWAREDLLFHAGALWKFLPGGGV